MGVGLIDISTVRIAGRRSIEYRMLAVRRPPMRLIMEGPGFVYIHTLQRVWRYRGIWGAGSASLDLECFAANFGEARECVMRTVLD